MATNDYAIKDIEKIVQGLQGEIKKVDISRLTAPGENYLSLVFRVDFLLEKDGRSKTVSVVAKRLPLGERKFDFNAIAMRNEIRWYSEILPLIKEFAKEFGITCDYFPEYMGSRMSLDQEKTEADDESVLLLKNLIPEGYKNEDRYIGFDLISAQALLRILAAFHATPLAIKFKKPDLFKIIKEYLENTQPGPPPEGFKGPGGPHKGPGGPPKGPGGPPGGPDGAPPPPPDGKVINKMLDIPACQPYRAKIEALKDRPRGPSTWNQKGKEPWNTAIHCDYWVNNVMVKPIEGEEPLVKVVDFQMCSYSSYAKDVVFFLLSSIRNDIQKQHFDELLRYYYDQFTSILNRVGIPELELTYEEYLEEVKRVARESEACHALFFSTVIFGEKGTGPDILTGEVDMFDHMEYMINNMNDHQKEKLAIMTELCAQRDWI